jgi:tetratricopeptide (TPR) repeat protein
MRPSLDVVIRRALLALATAGCTGCSDGYQEPSSEQTAAYLNNLDEMPVDESVEDDDPGPQFDWATAYTRGVEHLEAGDYAGAVVLFTDCVDHGATNDLVMVNRGLAYRQLGEYELAIADLEQGTPERGGWQMAYFYLAELLAACPDAELRDGARAVEIATKACEWTEWRHAGLLAVLAAAYAELGDFEDAVKWQTEAGKYVVPEAAGEMERRLALYRSGQPCHELFPEPRGLSRDPDAEDTQ